MGLLDRFRKKDAEEDFDDEEDEDEIIFQQGVSYEKMSDLESAIKCYNQILWQEDEREYGQTDAYDDYTFEGLDWVSKDILIKAKQRRDELLKQYNQNKKAILNGLEFICNTCQQNIMMNERFKEITVNEVEGIMPFHFNENCFEPNTIMSRLKKLNYTPLNPHYLNNGDCTVINYDFRLIPLYTEVIDGTDPVRIHAMKEMMLERCQSELKNYKTMYEEGHINEATYEANQKRIKETIGRLEKR